jgi:hypothetical protein
MCFLGPPQTVGGNPNSPGWPTRWNPCLVGYLIFPNYLQFLVLWNLEIKEPLVSRISENFKNQRTFGSGFWNSFVMEKPLNPKKTCGFQGITRRLSEFWQVLDFFENCGYISDLVLGFLRTAVMYQDHFVDAFQDCGGFWQNPVIWIFEKIHGYISQQTAKITSGHLVPFLTAD